MKGFKSFNSIPIINKFILKLKFNISYFPLSLSFKSKKPKIKPTSKDITFHAIFPYILPEKKKRDYVLEFFSKLFETRSLLRRGGRSGESIVKALITFSPNLLLFKPCIN